MIKKAILATAIALAPTTAFTEVSNENKTPIDIEPEQPIISCDQDISNLSLSAIYEHSRAASVTVRTTSAYQKVEGTYYTVNDENKTELIKGPILKPLMQPQHGVGSGVVLDRDNGYIVTAAHVVESATYPYSSVRVVFEHLDDKKYNITASVIEMDKSSDIALLQYEPEDLKGEASCVNISKDDIKIGEDVHVVGSPFGIGGSVSFGKVTNDKVKRRGGEFMQTDASINTGNSGGGIFNTKGEVVGISSYIITKNGSSSGVGFGASSDKTDTLVNQFVQTKLDKEEQEQIKVTKNHHTLGM